MTFKIYHDGRTYIVSTEVGNGLARVVFQECRPTAVLPATGAAA